MSMILEEPVALHPWWFKLHLSPHAFWIFGLRFPPSPAVLRRCCALLRVASGYAPNPTLPPSLQACSSPTGPCPATPPCLDHEQATLFICFIVLARLICILRSAVPCCNVGRMEMSSLSPSSSASPFAGMRLCVRPDEGSKKQQGHGAGSRARPATYAATSLRPATRAAPRSPGGLRQSSQEKE